MKKRSRKVLLSAVSLAVLLASIILAFGSIDHVRQGHAQQPAIVYKRDFSIPAGSDPWGTAFDSKGRVWVAIPDCDPSPTCSTTSPGQIAVFNPAISTWVATHQLPSGFAQPLFLAFDAQGQLWFPMPMNNSLGMFNPTTKVYQQWAVPTPDSGPWDIAVDHSGNIWFTEHYGNKIGRFNPVSHTFTEIATPASDSQPYGITVDASNNVWFTENNSSVSLIGEYTAGGTLLEYKIRNGSTSNLTPHLITVDPNGNIWWTEGWAGMIGELQVTLAQPGTNNGVTEYAYPQGCNSCGTHASGISVDRNGLIWFDDSLQSTFGSFPDTGSGAFTIYRTPTASSHPHDGLQVDAQNRIWFDEELANRLARAIQSGVSTPTPTSTPSPTPTSTPSPTAGTVLGQDTFQRSDQAFWGTALDEQTWGGDANSANVFSLAGNTGQVASGINSGYNAVLGPVATDAEVVLSGSISIFNYTNFGAVLRWTDTNNWYRAYISGSYLLIQKKVNGTVTTLGTAPFAATAGTSYTLRFSVVGSTLSAKVWQTGSTEPANWMVTATDSTFQSGYCGLRMLVQNGATLTITSFEATAQ